MANEIRRILFGNIGSGVVQSSTSINFLFYRLVRPLSNVVTSGGKWHMETHLGDEHTMERLATVAVVH